MRRFAIPILGAILLILGTPAHAESYSYTTATGDRMRAFNEPCALATGWLAKGLKRAEIVYQGKTYAACWTIVDRTVVFFDEAGDVSRAPMAVFSKDLEA